VDFVNLCIELFLCIINNFVVVDIIGDMPFIIWPSCESIIICKCFLFVSRILFSFN